MKFFFLDFCIARLFLGVDVSHVCMRSLLNN